MRGDARCKDPGFAHRVVGDKENASFQVIVLVGYLHKSHGNLEPCSGAYARAELECKQI